MTWPSFRHPHDPTKRAGYADNRGYLCPSGPDGTHYDQTIAPGFGSSLDLATLHDGEHTSGVLVFDVKPSAQHGLVAYAPNYQGPAIVTWSY